jgi:DNA-directed RNA polymerase subunit RPC12/RpoP
MNRQQRRREQKLKKLPGGLRTTVPIGDLKGTAVRSPQVALGDREGVFIHGFKCMICGLEFHLFSWRANRHRVGEVYCPECGTQTPMNHRRVCISESTDFEQDSPNEIWRRAGLPGMVTMDDSRIPPETPAAEA